MIVSVGNQPAQFKVEPGSRFVNTMGDDLTSVLHSDEKILIEEELVEIKAISVDEIELKKYHVEGTNSMAVEGYRLNNYIGSTILTPGDSSLIEANGQNLKSVLRTGDIIQVTNDVGGKEYLAITSVTDN